MREIKEGEFCRINGEIAKVIGKDDDNNILLDTQKIVTKQEIKKVKHSFNIIDLIETLDILAFKIQGFDFISRGIVYEEYDARKGEYYNIVNGHRLEEIQIIKILTHEQYERDCYVVEEEE